MIVCSLSTAVRAVGQTISYTSRVIHLWVDPKNGDDVAATLNPSLNYPCQSPLPQYPCDVLDTTGKVLLHAPFPFKTVKAAIATVPQLPYTGGVGTNEVIWEYAVIHCLPGLYAPGNGSTQPTDVANGQAANGESFPIAVPNRVSIKGASALNTVFDAQDLHGPIFHFGGSSATRGIGSFIDGVSLIGAGRIDDVGTNTPQSSAAIYVGPRLASETNYASSPTISNCFIFGNVVGVLVNCTVNTEQEPTITHDGLTLINNTIAFNGFGLWNGWFDHADPKNSPSDVFGYSKLNLINNIFDSSPQSAHALPPFTRNITTNALILRRPIPYTSGFEGIHVNDLTIAGLTPLNGDTNAYEADISPQLQFYDTRKVILTPAPLMLPIAHARPGTGNRPATPGIDIAPFTGRRQAGMQRGVLYLQDLARLGRATAQAFQAGNTDYDGSPHDFRLSPAVLNAYIPDPNEPIPTPGANGARNLLVDRGWAGSFPVTMQNGLTIAHEPGYLAFTLNPVAQSTWLWTNRDQDCEGFANMRIRDHPAFPNANGWDWGIDVGADELGDLIKFGMRFGTTRFFAVTAASRGLPQWTIPMDHKYVWQIGLPQSLFPKNPSFALKNPLPPSYRSNYLVQNSSGQWVYAPGESWKQPGWLFAAPPSQIYYQPSVVDIAPHHLPDLHPWWTYGTPSAPITGFPTNPLWKLLDDSNAPTSCANASNAVNLNLYGDGSNALGAGTINPPGTLLPPMWSSYRWLDHLLTTGVGSPDFEFFAPANVSGTCSSATWGHAEGPVAPCVTSGPNVFTIYDEWCRGRRTVSPTAPTFDLLRPSYSGAFITAERYTLEYRSNTAWELGLTGSNIQSFLVAVETQ